MPGSDPPAPDGPGRTPGSLAANAAARGAAAEARMRNRRHAPSGARWIVVAVAIGPPCIFDLLRPAKIAPVSRCASTPRCGQEGRPQEGPAGARVPRESAPLRSSCERTNRGVTHVLALRAGAAHVQAW